MPELDRDKRVLYVEVCQSPDRDGKWTFVLDWWAEHFHVGPSWRGQVFHAKDMAERVAAMATKHNLQPLIADGRYDTTVPLPF